MNTNTLLPISFALFLIGGPAHAVNWVDTGHNILIDVDSIRKTTEGFVYYNDQDKINPELGVFTGAYDCQNGISYKYRAYTKIWSEGTKIIPGTMGDALMRFVCSRVR
jgi:hypothetical protein